MKAIFTIEETSELFEDSENATNMIDHLIDHYSPDYFTALDIEGIFKAALGTVLCIWNDDDCCYDFQLVR